MAEFFDMGGYAAYVWPAWGLTFAVLIANAVIAHRRHRKMLRAIRREQGGESQ